MEDCDLIKMRRSKINYLQVKLLDSFRSNAHLLAMHQHNAVESDRFVIQRTVRGESDICQRWMRSSQLHAEHVYIVPVNVQQMRQLVPK